MRIPAGLCAIALALSLPSAANAVAITGLFNTGTIGGVKQGLGGLETHWYISGGGTATTYNNAAYVVDPNANFITAGGPATYSLNFDLTGLNAATAQISGKFAIDNGTTIFLNGNEIGSYVVPTGDTSPYAFAAFQELHVFGANAGFVSGFNILSFRVSDYGLPSGLLVTDLAGTADVGAVPEPISWAMMVGGFGLLGASMRRRRIIVTYA